ncbi:MAG: hypothetical protein HY561_11735, partial [Gemmatimonadetes bacterium]|nr:hypothetical protein [Gemmatimonadota bacterium]
GAFLDTPTFPGFVMDVNASVGGTFSRQVYLGPQGDTIPSDIVAGQAIEWQTGTGNARALLTGKLAPLAFSQYRLEWQDRPYGPGEEFRVSAGLQDRFTESVNARATAATSLAQDTALVRRINQALGTDSVAGLTLEALAFPFEVTNVTESRDVQIAIVQHRTTVLLGQGADTQRVSVPAGKWTPGDRLVFLEVVNDTLRPTWHAVIGCTSTLRITCDATATAGYAAVVENGVTQDVIYFRPLVAGADFTATVAAERVDAVARKDDLKTIKVVPNPYVVFSEFERSASARVIKFTHVPDEGRLRIYTISGQFVQEIRWSEGDLNGTGDLEWNLRTRENTELAYGLYIWVLDSPAGTARGKFVVIR